jgi:hypothetical protein
VVGIVSVSHALRAEVLVALSDRLMKAEDARPYMLWALSDEASVDVGSMQTSIWPRLADDVARD